MAMLKPATFLHAKPLNFNRNKSPISTSHSSSPLYSRNLNSFSVSRSETSEISVDVRRMVEDFDPNVPLQEALTPPSSWYTESSFLDLEFQRVFYRGWQAVESSGIPNPTALFTSVVISKAFDDGFEPSGFIEQVQSPHDFFTGRLGNVQFVICRDANGNLHAFHNVCRHHASLLASGSGKKSSFVCPYHGWTYGLDGALHKATRITGIRNFKVNEFGLIPLNVATWGPFVLINLHKEILPQGPQQNVVPEIVGNEWLGSSSEILNSNGINSSLRHVHKCEYILECNWKVFCDNYLDGGYHVPYAHGGLASGLNLDSYSTTMYEKVSIQRCEGTGQNFDRLGSNALYAFVYPNFMINRYGPWMDTNLVLPLGPSRCVVIFDYFLEASLKDDKNFIESSLKESERVQIEDIALCEGVQKGLESPAYISGRFPQHLSAEGREEAIVFLKVVSYT